MGHSRIKGFLRGFSRQAFMESILDKIRAILRRQSSPTLSIKHQSTELCTEELTAYQTWLLLRKSINSKTPFSRLRKRSKATHPYLSEKVAAGDGFSLGSFVAFLGFIGVISLWLWSARPMLLIALRSIGFIKTAKEEITTTPMPMATPPSFFTMEQTPIYEFAGAKPTPDITMETPSVIQTIAPFPTPTPSTQFSKGGRIVGMPTARPDVYVRTGQTIKIRVSYYYPPLGGINCWTWDDEKQKCISTMASGEPWELYIGEAIACPPELPLGTVLEIEGGVYTCRDRGGAIILNEDGTYWIDFLADHLPVGDYYGQMLTANVMQTVP